MIEKRIRYFDDGGGTGDGGGGDGGDGGDSNQSGAESARLARQESAATSTPAPSESVRYSAAADSNAAYTPAEQAAAAVAGLPRYSAAQDSADAYSTWDNLKAYVSPYTPSWSTIGNIASIAVPALRAPMAIANMANSISNDPSASNVIGNVLAAPVARLTGLTPSAVASLAKGDVGNAVAGQAVGAAYGDLSRALGVQSAPALGLANAITGATGEAKQAVASAINNALSDRSTSTTAPAASQGTTFASNDAAPTPAPSTSHNPVTTSIASILGVPAPTVSAARSKQAPLDIVQQLMAMQNAGRNLKSVPASTGGSIDDLIRLTRS